MLRLPRCTRLLVQLQLLAWLYIAVTLASPIPPRLSSSYSTLKQPTHTEQRRLDSTPHSVIQRPPHSYGHEDGVASLQTRYHHIVANDRRRSGTRASPSLSSSPSLTTTTPHQLTTLTRDHDRVSAVHTPTHRLRKESSSSSPLASTAPPPTSQAPAGSNKNYPSDATSSSSSSSTGRATPLSSSGVPPTIDRPLSSTGVGIVDTPIISSSSSSTGSNCLASFEAPSIDAILSGNKELLIAFQPPPRASQYCTLITSYLVSEKTGVRFVEVKAADLTPNPNLGGALLVRLDGLVNGVAYEITVKAKHDLILSPPSVSSTATPATAPSPPTLISTVPGDSSIVISFTPPADNGGSPITGYVVYNLNTGDVAASGPSSPILVNNLVNGQGYQFVVAALNAMGTGPPSTPLAETSPLSLPPSPSIFAIQSGLSKRLKIFFFSRQTTGATADSYRITGRTTVLVPNLNGTLVSSVVRLTFQTVQTSPAEIVGLIDGSSYNISVVAVNAIGETSSVPVAVTVGATAPSVNYLSMGSGYNYVNLCVNTSTVSVGTLDGSGTDWDALGLLSTSNLVNCSALIIPPRLSSTGSEGVAKSSSTGTLSSTAVAVSSSTGAASSSSATTTSISPGFPQSSSSTGASSSSSSGAAFPIISFMSSTGVSLDNSLPPAGAVRMEIHLNFDIDPTKEVDVVNRPAAWWKNLTATWAASFDVDPARVVILMVDPNSATTIQQPKRRLLGATKRAVTLIVDILPPLSADDHVSSQSLSQNLTTALQDPNSRVAQNLLLSGGAVSEVVSVSNPGDLTNGGTGSNGIASVVNPTSPTFAIAVGIGAAVVFAILALVGFYFYRRHRNSKSPPKKAPVPTAYDTPDKAKAATPYDQPISPGGVRIVGNKMIDPEDYAQRGRTNVNISQIQLEPAEGEFRSDSPFHRAMAQLQRMQSQQTSEGFLKGSGFIHPIGRDAEYLDHDQQMLALANAGAWNPGLGEVGGGDPVRIRVDPLHMQAQAARKLANIPLDPEAVLREDDGDSPAVYDFYHAEETQYQPDTPVFHPIMLPIDGEVQQVLASGKHLEQVQEEELSQHGAGSRSRSLNNGAASRSHSSPKISQLKPEALDAMVDPNDSFTSPPLSPYVQKSSSARRASTGSSHFQAPSLSSLSSQPLTFHRTNLSISSNIPNNAQAFGLAAIPDTSPVSPLASPQATAPLVTPESQRGAAATTSTPSTGGKNILPPFSFAAAIWRANATDAQPASPRGMSQRDEEVVPAVMPVTEVALPISPRPQRLPAPPAVNTNALPTPQPTRSSPSFDHSYGTTPIPHPMWSTPSSDMNDMNTPTSPIRSLQQ